jgi:hypothetical protein
MEQRKAKLRQEQEKNQKTKRRSGSNTVQVASGTKRKSNSTSNSSMQQSEEVEGAVSKVQVWKLFPVFLFLLYFSVPASYFSTMTPDRLYHKTWDKSFTHHRWYCPLGLEPTWLLPGRFGALWSFTMNKGRAFRCVWLRYRGDDALQTFLKEHPFTEMEKKRVRPDPALISEKEACVLICQLRDGMQNSTSKKRAKLESQESGSTQPVRPSSKSASSSTDPSTKSPNDVLFRTDVVQDDNGNTLFRLLTPWPIDLGSKDDVLASWVPGAGKALPVLRIEYPPRAPVLPPAGRVVDSMFLAQTASVSSCLTFPAPHPPSGTRITIDPCTVPNHSFLWLHVSYPTVVLPLQSVVFSVE